MRPIVRLTAGFLLCRVCGRQALAEEKLRTPPQFSPMVFSIVRSAITAAAGVPVLSGPPHP
ncbi:hypothetical protein [Pararhizobium sp. O133]|uniref:hypothetical protein n=1 Tax=Pararhizobium sp. O133 TaxID=3449278 RepID=UPI003F6846DC